MVGDLQPNMPSEALVGLETGDDAAVWRLDDDRALVSTADFITPVVDDAYTWGRVAAANSVSDVYAMGGRPLFALNLVGWNTDALPTELLGRLLAGGQAVADEGGFVVVGGHTIDDPEPKYGMAVTGEVHPDRILTNTGLQPGQDVVLTKPLGIGVITTAIKADRASTAVADAAVASMTRLNDIGSGLAVAAGATGCTDVTGFGLLGHLGRMAVESKVRVTVDFDLIPFLDGALDLAADGMLPGGSRRNLAWAVDGGFLDAGDRSELEQLLVADAQTSGGLVFGVDPARAYLEQAVSRCDVCLVVIGRGWLTATDADHRARLEDPRDFVRFEVAAALARNIPIVPLLVQGAKMPQAEELPPDLSGLAYRQGTPVKRDPDFTADLLRLRQALRTILQPSVDPARPVGQPGASALPMGRSREASERSGVARPGAESAAGGEMIRLSIEVPGTLSTRPRPEAPWTILETPGEVVAYDDEEFKFAARRSVRDAEASDLLAKLSALRLIGIDLAASDELTAAGLTGLDSFQALESLELGGCSALSDPLLATLGRVPSLRSLELEGCIGFTEPGLQALRRLSGLEHLGLSELSSVTGRVLRALSGLSALRDLNLAGCNALEPRDAFALGSLPLERLDLGTCRWVSNQTVRDLAGLRRLNELDLRRTAVGPGLGSALAGLPDLRTVWCHSVATDLNNLDGIEHSPSLESLQLAGNPWLTDQALVAIGRLKTLRSLSVVGATQLTAAGIEHLASARLQHVRLRGCNGIDDVAIQRLSTHPLISLDLVGCPLVTEGSLAALQSVPSLRQLDLRGCGGLSDGGVRAFQAARSDVEVSWS